MGLDYVDQRPSQTREPVSPGRRRHRRQASRSGGVAGEAGWSTVTEPTGVSTCKSGTSAIYASSAAVPTPELTCTFTVHSDLATPSIIETELCNWRDYLFGLRGLAGGITRRSLFCFTLTLIYGPTEISGRWAAVSSANLATGLHPQNVRNTSATAHASWEHIRQLTNNGLTGVQELEASRDAATIITASRPSFTRWSS